MHLHLRHCSRGVGGAPLLGGAFHVVPMRRLWVLRGTSWSAVSEVLRRVCSAIHAKPASREYRTDLPIFTNLGPSPRIRCFASVDSEMPIRRANCRGGKFSLRVHLVTVLACPDIPGHGPDTLNDQIFDGAFERFLRCERAVFEPLSGARDCFWRLRMTPRTRSGVMLTPRITPAISATSHVWGFFLTRCTP